MSSVIQSNKNKKIAALLLCLVGFTQITPLSIALKEPKQPEQTVAPSQLVLPNTNLVIEQTFPENKWWETAFNDPILNGYIDEALNNNPNLKQVSLRVDEARANARASLGRELPQIDIGANANQRWVINGNSFGSAGGGFAIFSPNINQTTYSSPLQLNYGLDIFRKKRDRTIAQQYLTLAQQKMARQAQNLLVSELMTSYFNLAAINSFISLQTEQYNVSNNDVELTQLRFDEGVINEAELARKKQINSQIQKALSDSQLIANTLKNQIATLMGKAPSPELSINTTPFENIKVPMSLKVGQAQELLNERKDIAAALDALEAAKIDTRIAKKAYLPDFNVTGQLGYTNLLVSSIRLENLAANLAGSVLQALFTGGQRKANIKAAKARQEQALNEYFKVTITAFQEVNDALNAIENHQKALTLQNESDLLIEKQFAINQLQLDEGLLSKMEILPILNDKVVSKQNLIQAQRDLLLDIVSLNRSLGGGF